MKRDKKSVSRRIILTGAALAVPGVLAATPVRAGVRASAARAAAIDPDLLRRAREAFERHADQIVHKDLVAIADYGLHSSTPRFHLYEPEARRLQSFRVAHGKGSDPRHTGYLQSFSDRPGSAASSEGAYLTGEHYSGQHGASQRLVGLDAENQNAMDRAIVIHGAWYCEPSMVTNTGKLGRSEGCFAFSAADAATVLARLSPGHLLFSSRA